MATTLMSIRNYLNDDQMVPQFDCSSPQGSVSSGCASSTDSQEIPDFDTLLSDINSTIEEDCLSSSSNTSNQMELSNTAYMLGRPYGDPELTFYDETPVHIKQEVKEEKMERHHYEEPRTYTEMGYMADALAHTNQYEQQYELLGQAAGEYVQLESVNDRDTDMAQENARQEVDQVCARLGIPPDPYQWTVPQVQKWAEWALADCKLDPSYAFNFRLDGTQLCLMSEVDFEQKYPTYGKYLQVQLEFWKSAYNLTAAPQPQAYLPTYQEAQQYEETRTYTDLSVPQPQNYSGYVTMHDDVMVGGIPKPVFSAPACRLSPAPSLDSLGDSSHFSSSPTSYSEPEHMERTHYTHDLTNSHMEAMLMRQQTQSPMMEVKSEIVPSKQNIHLWQFLRELLLQPSNYGNCIRWLDRPKGIFRIDDSARVARLWGGRKNRPAMNYDKLSRSIRQYYKKGIIKKTDNSKRLVYQFCPQYRV